jgi:hypothetical protein
MFARAFSAQWRPSLFFTPGLLTVSTSILRTKGSTVGVWFFHLQVSWSGPTSFLLIVKHKRNVYYTEVEIPSWYDSYLPSQASPTSRLVRNTDLMNVHDFIFGCIAHQKPTSISGSCQGPSSTSLWRARAKLRRLSYVTVEHLHC